MQHTRLPALSFTLQHALIRQPVSVRGRHKYPQQRRSPQSEQRRLECAAPTTRRHLPRLHNSRRRRPRRNRSMALVRVRHGRRCRRGSPAGGTGRPAPVSSRTDHAGLFLRLRTQPKHDTCVCARRSREMVDGVVQGLVTMGRVD